MSRRPPHPLSPAVIAALRAHPHDDTPAAICARIGDGRATPLAVAGALEDLRERGIVISGHAHWQLTWTGYRSAVSALDGGTLSAY